MNSLASRRELHIIPQRSLASTRVIPTPSHQRLPFPVPLTSFVGREHEIHTLCELLRCSEIRLLTLIGTGGVGKTRLGLQVATHLSKDFANQVCFVSLTEINDPAFVLPTIARTLGLQDPVDRSVMEQLQAFLEEKRLLLLLDNIEQVIDAAPDLAQLLTACPGLKLLVTSRTALHISGEHAFLVPPLELPILSQCAKKEDLLHSPAITLFLERARTTLPGFALTEENSRLIAEICIRLDGLPLAIELAVPRLRVLSPHMLLQRLTTQQFQLLTQGMRDAPGRHQTLQNALEWSYRLLNTREQQLFRFLSIFAGSCTFQALEGAWRLAGLQREEQGWLLEAVDSLFDKSMLTRSTQEGEEPRLLLLRTLREYGLHQLTLSAEMEQFRLAHALYYLQLAEETEPALKGFQPRPLLESLQREHENLREAFCFFLANGEADGGADGGAEESKRTEMALRLGKALERFWIIGGHVREGRELLEQALKKKQEVSSSVRGYALCVVATLARYQGDFHAATEAGEESLAIFKEAGDMVGIAGSLYRLGYIVWMQGEAETARSYYEESLAVSGGEQCRDARSETLYCFASMAFFQGDAPTAHALIEESLKLSRELGDQYNIASALNILGWVMLLQGNIVAARALQEESLATNRELGNQRSIAHVLGALGEIAYRMGELERAYAYYEESLLAILRIDDRRVLPIYLERLASIAVAQSEVIQAVLLLSVAEATRQDIGTALLTPLEQETREKTLVALHDRLNEHVFATTWAQGKIMSPEQALEQRARQRPALPSRGKSPVIRMRAHRVLHDDLTQREQDVLRLVSLGMTDAQVAEGLVISRRTVNFHLTSIYRKLEVSSRSAATRYALEHDLF